MRVYALFFLLVLVQKSLAEEALVQFEEANQFYRAGDYQKAASAYEQILKNGYESASLYYNLGNAYFKTYNLPSAILYYERALRLSPHDEDVAYNLRLANLRVVDKIEPIPRLFFIEWWRSFVNIFSSGGWVVLGIVGLWCVVFSGAAFMIVHSIVLQRLTLFFAFIFVLVCLFSVIGTYQRIQQEEDTRNAIVFASSVSVKSAPDRQSTDLFVIHDGVKVELLDAIGDWKKIRLADGKVGWMPAESLQII